MLKMEILNEVTTVILVDLLLCFSEGNANPDEFELDIAFLACLFANLSVHLFFLIKDSIVSIKESCKRKCCNKRRTAKAPQLKYLD